jgi:phasin family protein
MQKEMFEQFSNFTKNSVKPLMSLNTLVGKAFERLTKQNLEIFTDVMNTQTAYMQNLANTKRVEDVVSLQTQVLKDSSNKAIHFAQKSFETIVDASSEFSKWLEEGVAAVAGATACASGVVDRKTTGATSKV